MDQYIIEMAEQYNIKPESLEEIVINEFGHDYTKKDVQIAARRLGRAGR